MSENNEVFTKIINDNGSQVLRIKAVWEENYLHITVIEGSNAWLAIVTEEDIRVLGEERGIEFELYFKNVKDYLCNIKPNVTFNVANDEFIIYRNIDNLRIKYFFTKLERIEYSRCVETLIDELSAKTLELSKQLKSAAQENVEACADAAAHESKLKEFVDMKENWEKEIYSCFIVVLNEKKKRIQYLTELLDVYKRKSSLNKTEAREAENIKTENESDASDESNVDDVSKLTRRIETLSNSDSGQSGYDTEEEKKQKQYFRDHSEPIPSTSKDNIASLENNSPPPILPKRFKSDKISITENKVQENISKAIREESVQMNEDDEDLPAFNTQDILDRM